MAGQGGLFSLLNGCFCFRGVCAPPPPSPLEAIGPQAPAPSAGPVLQDEEEGEEQKGEGLNEVEVWLLAGFNCVGLVPSTHRQTFLSTM